MKKINLAAGMAVVVTLSMFLSACTTTEDLKPAPTATSSVQDEQAENPFKKSAEKQREGFKTQVLGHVGHGLNKTPQDDKSGRALPLVYEGGEMQAEYMLMGNNYGKNVGLMFFFGGKPQPYRLADETKYQYIHVFDLEEDDKEYAFDIYFKPVTGQKGDLLLFEGVSIFRPSFKPDMQETFSYASYHSPLGVKHAIRMEADAPELDVSEITASELNIEASQTKEDLTDEVLAILSLKKTSTYTIDSFKSEPGMECLLNGEVVRGGGYNFSSEDDKLEVELYLAGPTGYSYEVALYLDHQPVLINNERSVRVDFEQAKASRISFSLTWDMLKKPTTFYVLATPCDFENVETESDISLCDLKSTSILLHNGTGTANLTTETEASQAVESDPEPSKRSELSSIESDLLARRVGRLGYVSYPLVVTNSEEGCLLYDLSEQAVICELALPDEADWKVFPVQDGFALAKFIEDDMEDDLVICFYNFRGDLLSELKMSDFIKDDLIPFPEDIALSPDGKQLAYISSVDVSIENINLREKSARAIVPGKANRTYEQYHGIKGFSDISFSPDSQKVIYRGLSPVSENSNEHYNVFGTVDITGDNFHATTNENARQELTEMIVCGNRILFSSSRWETGTGEVPYYDISNKAKGSLKLQGKVGSDESVWLYPSDTGAYFATCENHRDQDEEVYASTYRIYDVETGELIKEYELQDMAGPSSDVYIFAEARLAIIIKASRESELTKVVSFEF